MAHLFKYVTPDAARKILENGSLRWSTPATLNDPFDMQFAYQLRINRRVAREMALNKVLQHFHGELLDRPLNQLGHMIRRYRQYWPAMSQEEISRLFGDVIDESIR